MNIYLIKEKLEKSSLEEAAKRQFPYVALANDKEFYDNEAFFDMGIDLDLDLTGHVITNIEVNYDAIIGTFSIPDRENISGDNHTFAYALDEKGIVFINDDGYAQGLVENITKLKKWRFPSLERFIFDFLEQIVTNDLMLLEKYEIKLDSMEEQLHRVVDDNTLEDLIDIRSDIQDLRLNYEQLLDVSRELEENENDFFKDEYLRFFSMYSNRIHGLLDIVSSIKEHTIHVRELYNTSLEARQNKLMAILTIIATIFMPLTLIVGWYGMNFVYMPELQYKYSYPVVIGVCVFIVVAAIVYFKKNKWL